MPLLAASSTSYFRPGDKDLCLPPGAEMRSERGRLGMTAESKGLRDRPPCLSAMKDSLIGWPLRSQPLLPEIHSVPRTVSIGTVKLLNCLLSIFSGFHGDKGNALGSSGAVVLEVYLDNRTDSVEQLLCVFIFLAQKLLSPLRNRPYLEVVLCQLVMYVLDSQLRATSISEHTNQPVFGIEGARGTHLCSGESRLRLAGPRRESVGIQP